jgi:ADP-ribosylglycohydrolase
MREYYHRYPNLSYGGRFHEWARSPHPAPYNSWGNGAAMRISPVGFAYDDIITVLKKSVEYTAVTHNHAEGIKGAQAVAAGVFLAKKSKSKAEIREFIANNYGYDFSLSLDQIRPKYQFDESCQGTVPQAILCFLESTDFEDAIRNAVSLGGDSDTLACITGGIAQAYYGDIPKYISSAVLRILDDDLREIYAAFSRKYPC